MDTVKSRLTVYFEDPFWVGVYERFSGGKYETAKVTFGAEPKDYEVYDFFLTNFERLRFSTPVQSEMQELRPPNPKRARREAAKVLQARGIGTKAQQALKLQQEQTVTERKTRSREKREEEAERKREIRRLKQKEKHKGHLR